MKTHTVMPPPITYPAALLMAEVALAELIGIFEMQIL